MRSGQISTADSSDSSDSVKWVKIDAMSEIPDNVCKQQVHNKELAKKI